MKKKNLLIAIALVIVSVVTGYAIGRRVDCRYCEDGVVERVYPCERCKGTGVVENWRGEKVQCTASGCRGGVKILKQRCDICNGAGYLEEVLPSGN